MNPLLVEAEGLSTHREIDRNHFHAKRRERIFYTGMTAAM